MSLSDSLVVMNSGKIVAYFNEAASTTDKELGLYMLGLKSRALKKSGEYSMNSSKTKKRGLFGTIGLFFTDRDKLEPALITFLAAIFSILMGVGLIFIVSKDPVTSTKNFLLGPVLRTYNFYYLMIAMVPITFTGLALCIIYQLRYTSLIVDSSFYTGAIIATAIGVKLSLPPGIHPAVAMLAAGLAGGPHRSPPRHSQNQMAS